MVEEVRECEEMEMPRVFVSAKIKATWHGNAIDDELSTAKAVADVSVRLLVEELGTEKAKAYLRKLLSRYRSDYKGSGRGA